MTATTETTTVQTDLYINGEHRSTPETIDVPDPAKPGRIVGRAASRVCPRDGMAPWKRRRLAGILDRSIPIRMVDDPGTRRDGA